MTITDLESRDWFRDLVAEVQRELERLQEDGQCQLPALEEERKTLEQKIAGWSQSLAKPDLDPSVRRVVENDMAADMRRIGEIEAALQEKAAALRSRASVVDARVVLERLDRLGDVLAEANPSLANIELSLHIDRIDCFDDGVVKLRTCRLGCLASAIDVFTFDSATATEASAPAAADKVIPRRRTKRRLATAETPTDELKALAVWSADPNRFDGLDDRWFEETTFQIPKATSWAARNAVAVAAARKRGLTEDALAVHFGKSIPTIRKALRIAAEDDETLRQLPRKMPRPDWAVDHADEIEALRVANGRSVRELARQFDKSETTIRKAFQIARQRRQERQGKAC